MSNFRSLMGIYLFFNLIPTCSFLNFRRVKTITICLRIKYSLSVNED